MNIAKYFLLSAIAATTLIPQADAKIWRVNNMGYEADYAQISQAVADPNVLAGDTLHVEGSTTEYNSAIITKPLVIIGAGYFLLENPKTTNNGLATNIGYITFNNGSQNSQLIGLSVNSTSGININTNNITIKRCKIAFSVSLFYNISNITISQNYFENNYSSTSSAIDVSTSGFPTNVRFNNNIVRKPLHLYYDNPTYTFLECNNNVFDLAVLPSSGPSLLLYAASFKNNILVNSAASVKINGITDFTTTPNSAVTHNIGSSSVVHFGTANNNIVVSNMTANLFVPAASASSDGKYQLKASSSGSSNGSDGSDRGAFGGGAPNNIYVLSGVPPIPVIYEISTTGVATPSTGLDITIKARIVE